MENAEGRTRGARTFPFGMWQVAFGLVLVTLASCGKKGPPQVPLVIMPGPVTDVSARRIGDQVLVRFKPPEKNTDNSTPADLARVEIYALSVPTASAAPEAGVVARDGSLVGSVDFSKPASAAPEEGVGPRTFAERLNGSKGSKGSDSKGSVLKGSGSKGSEGAAGSAEGVGEGTGQPLRLYAIVPISSRGRRGPAMLATVSLAPAPAAPSAPAIAYTESAISLTWLAGGEGEQYNVYNVGSSGSSGSLGSGSGSGFAEVPLNQAPLKEATFEDPRVEFGKMRCYGVTGVSSVEERRVESELSPAACVTPVDTFPPPAPTGVAAVAGPGTMSLIWDAVNAPDLAGYVVLRGEAPGDTLQALTPEPIKETTFRDATVRPGTRYVYAVVALDTAKNASAQSARAEEIAR